MATKMTLLPCFVAFFIFFLLSKPASANTAAEYLMSADEIESKQEIDENGPISIPYDPPAWPKKTIQANRKLNNNGQKEPIVNPEMQHEWEKPTITTEMQHGQKEPIDNSEMQHEWEKKASIPSSEMQHD